MLGFSPIGGAPIAGAIGWIGVIDAHVGVGAANGFGVAIGDGAALAEGDGLSVGASEVLGVGLSVLAPSRWMPLDLELTTCRLVIPSYLYAQYTDDDACQTFVAAQNVMAQGWIDDFNTLNLPLYCGLKGALLDWVGEGLYGIKRPALSLQVGAGGGSGAYDTVDFDVLAYGEGRQLSGSPAEFLPVSDDVYKRMLTWHTYRGDGWQYSTRWLKQRVHRFLNGPNGVLVVNDNTADVSVSHAGAAVTITLASSEIGKTLKFAIFDGVLALPFQLSFTVALV